MFSHLRYNSFFELVFASEFKSRSQITWFLIGFDALKYNESRLASDDSSLYLFYFIILYLF